MIVWRGLGQRLESHKQLNTRSWTAVSKHIAEQKSNYDKCYAAYCGEYQSHQETRTALNQTRNFNQEIQKAIAREQEGHQYTRTELELLRHKLDEERVINENLKGTNEKLHEGMNEHERINNELHNLTDAMEKDNRAMRATIDQLQKEPRKVDEDGVDEDGVDVIGWSEAQEVISVCSPTLQTKVTNLEAEKEALKAEKEALEKQLQEAKDALMASQLSRKGNKRRKH